ncbi:zinc finger protein 90-like [Sphaerodactylus townsendi]|uniref:Uncharacterized protein n=1 Tax=Sphaerodactylus townsendi TaxID=933632 RepID=A0ACB8EWA2_9SAUR|nr:zinc finger protein 90-like [Sphaerodactylus townsendi]XP_048373921.1 zinc finger protein 90-like [Sphaerodactylus townsendi]
MEVITVKEETKSVTLPACCLCQEELPDLAGSPGQIPQCRACKSIILEPRNWLPGNQEARGFPADRPYSCSFCSKCFKRASDRRDHERVHTGERPYGCSICGKHFTQSSVLSGHMRIHTGERPFQCAVCFKSFNNSSNFRKHQRIHGQEEPYVYGAKGNSGKDCTILPEKRQSQPTERQDGGNQWPGKILRQNGHQSMKELRESENGSHLGRQNSPYVNGLLSQGGSSYGSSQPADYGNHSKKVRQGATYCGPDFEPKHRSDQNKTVDSKGRDGELGENGCHSPEQNGHRFRLVKYVNGENHTKGLRSRRAEESHAQGEQKQCAVSHSGRLQLDGVSCGKGLLLTDGNRDHIHRLIQNGGVRGCNGGLLKGLKLTGVKGTVTGLKQNGSGGSPNSGLRQFRNDNSIKVRPNVSHGGPINGVSENGNRHFGELSQDGGTSEEKQVNFQACASGNVDSLVPQMSVQTCPENGDMVWEEPDTEITEGRDDLEECSSFDRRPCSSPWEPGVSDSCSSPYDLSASPHQDQFTVQLWEGDSCTSYPFQDPEPYDQHSQSVFDSKPFLCFACPKQFRRATDLKEHLRVHTGERPFGCSVCGKRFTQSSALATHRRLHTGEKPFECTVCCRRFNNSSNFAKHRRLHVQDVGCGSKVVEKISWSVKPQ